MVASFLHVQTSLIISQFGVLLSCFFPQIIMLTRKKVFPRWQCFCHDYDIFRLCVLHKATKVSHYIPQPQPETQPMEPNSNIHQHRQTDRKNVIELFRTISVIELLGSVGLGVAV